MQRVINFSGGKTSAYMTIKYYKPGDLVIFCDTGREHFKTYKFINDLGDYLKKQKQFQTDLKDFALLN
jgi:3'-phosphoadenosine 5'-phosphosulfate sulfotransferase (PAPS reductase)/FAD synthetase